MRSGFKPRQSTYVLRSLVTFILCVLPCELVTGQDSLDVVVTEIDRRGSAPLDQMETEILDRSHWQLDASEWKRVEALTSGFRKYVSDQQISPLEVLGIHARTSEERRMYAHRWARLMIKDAERVLAFQRAYDAAVREIAGERPLVDLSKLPASTSSVPKLLPSDRLAVFIGLECVMCDEILKRVFQLGRELAGVDVYIVGVSEVHESELHGWARRQGIPPMAVQTKRITINIDNGLLKRVHPRADDIPVVMRRRGDRLEPINPWEML